VQSPHGSVAQPSQSGFAQSRGACWRLSHVCRAKGSSSTHAVLHRLIRRASCAGFCVLPPRQVWDGACAPTATDDDRQRHRTAPRARAVLWSDTLAPWLALRPTSATRLTRRAGACPGTAGVGPTGGARLCPLPMFVWWFTSGPTCRVAQQAVFAAHTRHDIVTSNAPPLEGVRGSFRSDAGGYLRLLRRRVCQLETPGPCTRSHFFPSGHNQLPTGYTTVACQQS